ncbi:hypothetical protein bcere0019_11350 [Bacillus cereus Rock3-28]|nr:hypothetical protein bcere0019_11350 [Bacillus cereus Rock3-28]
MNLCHLSIRETKKLYNTMKIAQELGIKIQEETLTELMLIDLKSTIQDMGLNTVIKHCNKSDEFKLGSDFLWFIGSNQKKSWVAFYIQAKKLREDQKYFLKHNYKNKIGNESAPIIKQVDRLIAAAEKSNLGKTVKHNAIPIYCFYNYLNDETLSDATYLKTFSHIPLKKENFSLTYTSAYHIQSLLKKPYLKRSGTTRNTFSFDEIKGLPIYTLFCRKNKDKSLAENLSTTYTNHYQELFPYTGRDLSLLFGEKYVFDELPSYVESLIHNTKDTSEEYDRKDFPSYIMVTYED